MDEMTSTQQKVYALDTGWMVEYFELITDLGEWAAEANPITALADWQFSGRYDEHWAAWLTADFTLEPILETCMRYELRIDAAPAPIKLFVNGRRMGEIAAFPFALDVTDYVTYEDNRLAIRVGYEAVGQFGRVYLVGTPCDE